MRGAGRAITGVLATLVTIGTRLAVPAIAAAAEVAVPDVSTPVVGRDEQAIELVAAYLRAWAEKESTRVECVYVLCNRGDSTSVRLPFPAPLVQRGGVPWTGLFARVRSFVDGVPVHPHTAPDPSDDRAGGDLMRWYLEPVSFAAHQTRCVRDVYVGERLETTRFRNDVARPDGDPSSVRWGAFGFELFPGRHWAGSVGTCDIVITLDLLDPGDEVAQSVPVATSHEGREWRWHLNGMLPGTGALPGVSLWWNRGARPQSR